jgi:hypothetical protein
MIVTKKLKETWGRVTYVYVGACDGGADEETSKEKVEDKGG